MTNFVINMYYFCDPDGKSEYVYSKKALPVDEMTPAIKHLTFTDVICRNSEVAAAFFYGLPESPIEEIKMKNIIFVFKEDSQEGIPAMMSYLKSTSKMGIYDRNVYNLILDSVKLIGYEGKEIDSEEIENLIEDKEEIV